jgi:hypothetical protein
MKCYVWALSGVVSRRFDSWQRAPGLLGSSSWDSAHPSHPDANFLASVDVE